MKTAALIPAKGYSTRFHGCKNLATWRGKSLLQHAIDAAAPADLCIVLTDSMDIVRACPAGVLAVHLDIDPDSTVLDTLRAYHREAMPDGLDALALLLPTCPQRTAAHVRDALMILREQDCDGVVSVCTTTWPASLTCTIGEDGALVPAPNFLTGHTRGQDQPKSFRPNGGVYCRTMAAWEEAPNFFAGRVWPYFMPRASSADVDTMADLERLRREHP